MRGQEQTVGHNDGREGGTGARCAGMVLAKDGHVPGVALTVRGGLELRVSIVLHEDGWESEDSPPHSTKKSASD